MVWAALFMASRFKSIRNWHGLFAGWVVVRGWQVLLCVSHAWRYPGFAICGSEEWQGKGNQLGSFFIGPSHKSYQGLVT